MNKATILSVDDDANLQLVIQEYLEDEGYRVLLASNRDDLNSYLDNEKVDVVLQDLMLPNDDGLSMISLVRAKSSAFVFVLSGKNDPMDKIIGLEMGADDYITKPFEMRELNARIKSSLRRQTQTTNEQASKENNQAKDNIEFGKWVLDRSKYQLFSKDGESMNLTTGEFELLEALALAPNRVLSREHLFELTRDGKFDVYDRAIDIQIGRIRKKICEDPNNPQYLKTVRGAGYMLII